MILRIIINDPIIKRIKPVIAITADDLVADMLAASAETKKLGLTDSERPATPATTRKIPKLYDK
jgi:hypothetical protein